MHAALLCIVPDGTVPSDGTSVRVAESQTIQCPVGDGGVVSVSFQGENGAAYNLTGASFTLVCRRHITDQFYAFAYAGVIDSAVGGTGHVTILAEHTSLMDPGASYWYDVRLVTAGATPYHTMPASKWIPRMAIARTGEP